ncbi:MAG: hypothetical protein ACJAS1_001448 [Oleiphilaceae bacterium]|jgi:hypothetical protein
MTNKKCLKAKKMNFITDLSNHSYYRAAPVCTECGKKKIHNMRDKVYACKSCKLSITEASWDIVAFHAASLDRLLTSLGIESILFHGIPIPVSDAVQSDHLLPHFLLTATLVAEKAGIENDLCLKIQELSEDALNTNACLLPIVVQNSDHEGNLAASIQLFIAVAKESVEDLHAESPGSSVMDSKYIFNYESSYN